MSQNSIWPLDNLENNHFIQNFGVRDYKIDASWQIIDLVSSLLHENIKKKNISSKAEISPTAIIDGNVIIESGVKIMEHAKIIGPTFIGKNVIIGNSALVRESYVADECVIGYLVDIVRSYVGHSCWLSRNHIADSFLDDEVNVGGGTILASLRLDGKPVLSQKIKVGAIIGKKTQIGVNVTVMPGVRIGKNCIIGPGVMVFEDLKDNLFCKVKQELVLRKNEVIYNKEVRDLLKEKLIQEIKEERLI